MRKWAVVAAILIAVGVSALVWSLRAPPEPVAPTSAPALKADFARIEVLAEPGEEGLVLEGRVLGASGEPVAGAEVHLVSGEQARLASLRCQENEALLLACTSPESPTLVAGLLAEGRGLLEPAASTVADAEGRFRFERLRGVSFTVWASGAGHGTALQDRAAPGEKVELFLPPLRSIEGRVIDEQGSPVGDARVWAVSRKLSLAVEVRTNASGRFALEGLGEGPFYVVAAAEGHLAAAELAVEAGPRALELRLVRPRELIVSVLRDGAPAEATIEVESNHLHRRADTKNGQARLGDMGRRTVMVRARAGSAASVPTTVSLTDPQTPITLHLVEGGTLWVTAVDADGQPVSAPTLALYSDGGPLVQEVKAGTGEAVAFGPVGPGDYLLTGQAEGFKPVDLPVRIKPGEAPIELLMQRGTTISGRVLDLYGRGASDISVLVQPSGELARADAEGRFSVLVPSPGEYTLSAHHSDWGGVEHKVSAPAEGIEISLEPGASLRAVVQAGGRRVEGASVRAWAGTQTTFNSDSHSGPDGVVWMRGLPKGTFTVIAEHPDYIMSHPAQAAVQDGQELTVELTLREGATLEGEVVDTEGAPVSGVTVLLSSHEPVQTDANGHFTAKGLLPGRKLVLNAVHPDYDLTKTVNVQVEAGTVAQAKLVLKRRGRYRGRVVSAAGKPLTHFRVENREFTDPSGRFEISAQARELTGGSKILLSIDAQGHLPEVRDFPADQLDVGTIELEAAPTFNGRVVDEGGSGVSGVVVSCLECDRRVLSADDGSFELDLPGFEGRMTLTASKGSLTAQKEVDVREAGAQLVLRSLSALSGAFYDAEGRPQGGVALVMSSSSLMDSEVVVTGSDGRFRYEASPGTIRLTSAPMPGDETATVMQIARLEEGGTQLALGRAPGTAQLTVKVPPRRGWIIAVVRGDFEPGAQMLSRVMEMPWAQLAGLGGRSFASTGGTAVFRGLTPGRYTVVFGRAYAYSQQDEIVRRIDVRGDQELTIDAPELRPQ